MELYIVYYTIFHILFQEFGYYTLDLTLILIIFTDTSSNL